MKNILVVGSSNIDYVLNVDEMPKKGETIKSRMFSKIPGGKGANQACACGKLGGNCTFLSVLGNDDISNIVIDSLNKAGVNTSSVKKVGDMTTGLAVITVNKDGENSIILTPGANEQCNNSYFAQNLKVLDDSQIVLIQLETPIKDVYSFIRIAKDKGKVVVLNPAPAPTKIDISILNKVDYITPNETELQKMTGMPVDTINQIQEAAQALIEKGANNVIVTIGSKGALLCNRGQTKLFKPFKVKPVDTTAAGDTFNAALTVGLSDGKSLSDSIVFANAAAALTTTSKGAQTSIPLRRQVEEFINKSGENYG